MPAQQASEIASTWTIKPTTFINIAVPRSQWQHQESGSGHPAAQFLFLFLILPHTDSYRNSIDPGVALLLFVLLHSILSQRSQSQLRQTNSSLQSQLLSHKSNWTTLVFKASLPAPTTEYLGPCQIKGESGLEAGANNRRSALPKKVAGQRANHN